MSLLGWVVIVVLGLYALALFAIMLFLGPQLIRDRHRKEVEK